GSWWCATVNSAPNVTTPKPNWGSTHQVCLPRDYCSPCQKNHDCAAIGGVPEACTQDSSGNNFCANICQTDAGCRGDAHCAGLFQGCAPADGTKSADGRACQTDDDCGSGKHCITSSTTPFCAAECGSDADCGSDKCLGFGACTPNAGVCKGDGSF